jgi:predicted anti-sigma-YlaC factor YlaD
MTTEQFPLPLADELACKELVELVTEYLEGTLPDRERARFGEHLGLCPGCRAYLEQMRQTIRVLGPLSEESIAPRAREELLRAFRDWKRA